MFVWSRINNTFSFEQITYFEPYYFMHNGPNDMAYTQDFEIINTDTTKIDGEVNLTNSKFVDDMLVGTEYSTTKVLTSPNGFVYFIQNTLDGEFVNCKTINDKKIICCVGKFYISDTEYKFSTEYNGYKVYDILFYKNSYYFVLFGNKTVVASTDDFKNFNYVELLDSDNYPVCCEMNEDQMVILSKNKNIVGRTTINYSNDGLSWRKVIHRNEFNYCYYHDKSWIFAGNKNDSGLIARMPLIISSEGLLVYDDIQVGKLTNISYLNNRLFVYGPNDLLTMEFL